MMFDEQVRKKVEVYMGDMLVKSKAASNHDKNLEHTFTVPRQYRMKLNRLKCTFAILSDKFLWYIVNA